MQFVSFYDLHVKPIFLQNNISQLSSANFTTYIPTIMWMKQNWERKTSYINFILYRLAFWVKFSADNILKYFYFSKKKTGLDISCKLSPKETICMKCQNLFSEKKKKNIYIFQNVICYYFLPSMLSLINMHDDSCKNQQRCFLSVCTLLNYQ